MESTYSPNTEQNTEHRTRTPNSPNTVQCQPWAGLAEGRWIYEPASTPPPHKEHIQWGKFPTLNPKP